MEITLINPNIVTQKGDFLGSGIPYMPISLAYLAAYLKQKHNITVIDAFGENPFSIYEEKDLFVQGLTYNQILSKIKKTEAVIIYANSIMGYDIFLNLIKKIKKKFNVPIIIAENSQSVTSFSLKDCYQGFFESGADYLVLGDLEERTYKLLDFLKKKDFKKIDGLIFKEKGKIKINEIINFQKDLDSLPYPAWDLFPLKNYWKLGYAHGPLSSNKYLPLLTSRGCSFNCKFCVAPETNKKNWRAKSFKKVVDEMEHWSVLLGVNEFHWEDLNPTIDKKRMKDISQEILNRGLKIKWKFASGSKIETVDEETIKIMAKAGCNYISFSPETGSKELLKKMGKPFDHELALRLTKIMHKKGIKSQACFILGFPGENKEDLMKTKDYIKKLVRVGLDELAIFIVTPIPGTETFDKIKGYDSFSQLTFSPKWRKDFKKLDEIRSRFYAIFLLRKLLFHPLKLFRQPFNILRRSFETKMEMTLYRILKFKKILRNSN